MLPLRALLLSCSLAVAPVSVLAAERVVTLAPHLAELVCAAAGCGVLVAVGAYSDYPPEIKTLPVMGDAAQLNLEALMALRPTQVIAWQGGTPASQLARMQTVRLPVTTIAIEHLDEVADALQRIGVLLGTSVRADAAAADYRQRLAALRTRYRNAPRLRVLYQIETAPVYTINGHSPISEAITLCGGENVFANLPTLAAPVSDEAVLLARPQVVVHGPADVAAVRAYWSRFKSSPAWQPQLSAIDPDLLARPGPRLVQGVEQLCEALDTARQVLLPKVPVFLRR